ncbi:hypothetical protein [Chroococcidiopsis sp.]
MTNDKLPTTNYPLPITHYPLPITLCKNELVFLPVAVTALG